MVERQHLAILRAIKQDGSLTSAAERLNVSQSALSHTIRKLEERYGVQLWTKQGRGVRFTQAGDYLVELANRIIPQIEHAERTLSDYAQGRRGALRIGMECHPCEHWLMQLTPRYLAAWPGIDLDVRTAFPFDGVAALSGYEIDLLLTPDPVDLPDLVFFPVFEYDLAIVVHESHPLANREWVEPEDLVNETLITIPVSIERLDIFTRFLIPARCRPFRHKTIETPELILQYVAARRSVSVLPDWLVREKGGSLPICALRPGPEGIRKSINVGMRRDEQDIPYLKGFRELAQTFRMGAEEGLGEGRVA